MSAGNDTDSWFDDDFEVVYEEDISDRPDIDLTETKLIKKPKGKEKAQEAGPKVDLSISPSDVARANMHSAGNRRKNRQSPDPEDYDADAYEDEEDYGEEDRYHSGRKSAQKKRQDRPVRLAAPLQKGTAAAYNLTTTLLRNLTAILILAIIGLLFYNFIRASAPYGDMADSIAAQSFSQKLAAYLVVAGLLILYELFALLRTMSRVRISDRHGSYRRDAGKGAGTFITFYLLSYASFLFSQYIPDANDVLSGIKGALDVFGAMHNTLFGLCLAGVISCMIRKRL